MIKRPLRPSYAPTDKGDFLIALKAARDGAVKLGPVHGYHSPEYRACATLIQTIDALAGILTGNPSLFYSVDAGNKMQM